MQQKREQERKRRREHPEFNRAGKARWRAAKKNATPPWVNHATIREVYKWAAVEGKHVDHIIPLQHPQVCGLHVSWNLQLLTQSENSRKYNKFRPIDTKYPHKVE